MAIEEIGRVDQTIGITLSAGVGLGANPILRFGDDDQRTDGCPTSSPAERSARSGSPSPTAAATPARPARGPGSTRRVGDRRGEGVHHELGHPDHVVITVTARTDDGISAFVVPAGTPGLIVEPAYRKLGWHASDTHGLTLDDCRVPADHLLGEPGEGFRNFLAILDDGRIAISALAARLARACLDHAWTYAKERNAFGGPIGRNQGVAFELADLAVAVENARNLTYKAAWMKDQGRPFGQAAAMAKLYSTEAAVTHPDRDAGVRRLRVHGRDARSPASTATPRSSRSAKARARSSASSSPAASACPSNRSCRGAPAIVRAPRARPATRAREIRTREIRTREIRRGWLRGCRRRR